MAYKMVSPSKYPFRRENAKFFSQELIENVLFDFGHIWKPQRSNREIQLRKVASFVFVPSIGRLVAYISRKYAGFVVMRCYSTWNYINSHRPSVRGRMLCNEIVTLCVRSELEDDDLSLFTFMAMAVDYARLALTHEQENLIEIVVDALSYCLTDKIPGGFVTVLDRMLLHAVSFNYPRSYVFCDYDEGTQFATPVSTDSVYTPKSEFESPIRLEYASLPNTCYSTPKEDVVMELKNRKVHQEHFRLKMMTECATQTDIIERTHGVARLESFVSKSEQVHIAQKIDDKNGDLAKACLEGMFKLVETNDVAVQTWSSTKEQLRKFFGQDERKRNEQTSKDACSLEKHVLDLNAVVKKLKALECLQIEDELEGNSCLGITNMDIKNPDNKDDSGSKNFNTSLPTGSLVSQERDTDSDKQSFDDNTDKKQENLLEDLENKALEKGTNVNESLGDSMFESFDVSTDDPTKIAEEHFRENYNSFDSQIGSLDESIRTSDESRLEN